MAYRDTVLTDNPLWYLEFEQASGDFTNAGSAGGTATAGATVTRNTGGAASIGGKHITLAKSTTTSRVTVSAGNSWLSDRVFTLEAWVKTSAVANSTISQYNSAHYYILQMNSNGTVNFQFSTNASLSATSTGTINNGQWHHVAVVMNNTTATIYIDGVADGTATNASITGAFTSNVAFEIGNNSSTGTWAGDIDEFAVFDAALTGTRIAAHKAAGTATAVSHTAAVLTASGSMPGGQAVIPVSKTVNATALTASATLPGGQAATLTAIRYAVADATIDSAFPDANDGTGVYLYLHGTNQALLRPDLSLPNDAVIGKARLVMYPVTTAPGSYNLTVTSIDEAWSESTVTWNSRPSTGAVAGGTVTGGTGVAVDVTAIARAMQAGTAFGFMVDTNVTASTYLRARENGSSMPYLELTYASSGNVETVAVPLTGTAAIVEAAVTAGTGAVLAVTPATATAALVGATVQATDTVLFAAAALTASAAMPAATLPNVSLAADALEVSAAMPDATVVGGTTAGFAQTQPLTASADSVDATFSNQTDRDVYATALHAEARWVGVYDQATDPYVLRLTQQTLDTDDFWLRLDETSGTDAFDHISGGVIGTFNGPVEFNVPAPLTRKAIGFPGNAWLDMQSGDVSTVMPDTEATIEFVFRTTKANQVIAKGTGAASIGSPYLNIVSMAEGRLVVRPGGFSPTMRLDDGEWHHVVVSYRPSGNGSVLEIVIDRQLVMRRYTTQTLLTEIDSIGRGDGTTDWFEGDMMEFVQRVDHSLTLTDAVRNSYAVFGDTVIESAAMQATATTPNATGRGNQKRALMLFFNYEDERFAGGTWRPGDTEDYPWSGILGNEAFVAAESFDWMGYKVFKRSVRTRPAPVPYGDTTTSSYFDEVTGELGYIDLRNDIAVGEYDLLFFADLPPKDYFGTPAYEALIEGVRYAVDQGVSLWCPQPQLAIDLGLVEQVSWHPLLRETSAGTGLYDYRSYDTEHAGFLVEYPQSNPAWYVDTHYLNKYRIVGTIDGLTTYGGYEVDDYVRWVNVQNPFANRPDYLKVSYKQFPTGLVIGDTLRFPTPIEDSRSTAGLLDRHLRRTVVGVPGSRWHAGVAVAKEQATLWTGTAEVQNPYADWTLTFVVRPGDVVRGRPVGGKVFVDFMSGYTEANQFLPRQLFDPTADDAYDGYDFDTRRMRSFVTNYEWMLNFSAGFQRSVTLPVLDEYPVYPTVNDLRHYSMLERAALWLGEREPADRVYTVAATATATMPAATVSTQRSSTVSVQPALATAALVKPTSIEDPDVAVLTLPLTAQARFGKFQRVVSPAPATATATMPEPLTQAGGEQVVVFLRTFNPTVYLKEVI